MNVILRIEEWAQLILGIAMFSQLSYAWWVFPLVFLLPDIGMLGYLINGKIGARLYNLLHFKALGIAILITGYFHLGEFYTLVGIIIFSHAAFDRALGYGLKYEDNFKNTHLGKIGKK